MLRYRDDYDDLLEERAETEFELFELIRAAKKRSNST